MRCSFRLTILLASIITLYAPTLTATSLPDISAADVEVAEAFLDRTAPIVSFDARYKIQTLLDLDFSERTPVEGFTLGDGWSIDQGTLNWEADLAPGGTYGQWSIFGPFEVDGAEYGMLSVKMSGQEGDVAALMISTDGLRFQGVRGTVPPQSEWLDLKLELANGPVTIQEIQEAPRCWIAIAVESCQGEPGLRFDDLKLRLENESLPPRYSKITAPLAASREELLQHYAPTIYQIDDDPDVDSYVPFGDYITRFDYDGNYNSLDNWDNLSTDCGDDCNEAQGPCNPANGLPAYVYASSAETATHVFLQYAVFHPADDYKQPGDFFDIGTHENDLEGIQLLVEKDGSVFGRPLLLQVQSHHDFYQHFAPGATGIYEDEETDDGTYQVHPGTDSPVVVIEQGTHAISVEPPPASGRILYRLGAAAQDPSDHTGAEFIEYELLSTSSDLWPRRFSYAGPERTYEEPGSYEGTRFRADYIGLKFGGDTCMSPSSARASAPWNWSDINDPIPDGDWFMDPAIYVDWQFNFDGEFSLDYDSHEFFPEGTTTLPRGEFTIIIHGADQGGNSIDWTLPLARHIRWMDADPDNVDIYRIHDETLSFVSENDDATIPDQVVADPSSHKILIYDWSESSALELPGGAPGGYAFSAGDVLYNLLRKVGFTDRISTIIGHSRGSVVTTEVVRRMALSGYDVDQVVFLDGEGGHFDNLGGIGFDDDRFGAVIGTSGTHYTNIYTEYEEAAVCYGGLDFGGHARAGTHNINLGERYRHGGCALLDINPPPPVWDFLMTNMEHDGSRFTFLGYDQDFYGSPDVHPADWGTIHSPGHAGDVYMFNGDLAWGSFAGWENHGGQEESQSIHVVDGNHMIKLNWLNSTVIHSYTWIPEERRNLQFSFKVEDEDGAWTNDTFKVTVAGRQGPSYPVFARLLSEAADWDTKTIRIPHTIRNDVCTITFEIASEDVFIESTVLVDDVSIVPDQASTTAADIVTCLDRSGSMRGQKIADAKNAASTFVGLMNTGDKIGVTSFSSSASVNYPLTLIQSQIQKDQAIGAINGLVATGGTSIGSGMLASQGQLDNNGHPDARWAIVLLSDGLSDGSEYNVLPTIPEQTDIFTIGLGAGADEALLNYIASETGGTYHAAPSSQDLQQIYNAIRGQITGEQTVVATSGMIDQGQTVEIPDILLDQTSGATTFSISWSGSDIDLILHAPDGSVVDPGIAGTDPDVEYYEAPTYEYYRLLDPLPGIWRMELTGVEIPAGGEPYNAVVQSTSDLRMTVEFVASEHVVCDPINLIVTLTDFEIPVTGATIVADIDAPLTAVTAEDREALHDADETVPAVGLEIVPERIDAGTIEFHDDGLHGDGAADDGVYGAFYSGTETIGSYTFAIRASGEAPVSGVFEREDLLTTIVVAGSTSPPTAILGADPLTGPSPLSVQFDDLSAGCINARLWEFGDGTTSPDPSPVHVYSAPGEYTATLTVYGPGGTGVATAVITVEPGGCLWTDATTGPLADERDGHGIAWGDFDDDGDQDLFLANAGWNVLLRNDLGGVFYDTDLDFGYGDSRAAAWGDYDGDGDLDLYLVNMGSDNALFRNDGGVFEDVTTPALAGAGDGNGCAWADYDNDGRLDLFVVNETGPNTLLHNENGVLTPVAGSAVAFDGLSRGCAFGDYDDDGDLDLYVTVKDGANRLFRNDGAAGFMDVSGSPMNDDGDGKGCAWADYDNDGDLDLYAVNQNGPNRLFRNDGSGWFEDAADPVVADDGDGRTAVWGDYDNDGWLDLFVSNYSTPNKLYHNLGDGSFADSTCGALASVEMTAWGAGFADQDLDGDLDLYVSNHTWTGAPNRLFANARNSGKWLEIVLRGEASNRRGVGAKVEVTTLDGVQTRHLGADAGYMAQQPDVVHVGLGEAASAVVRVTWPSGLVQEHSVTGVEHRITITEGAVTGVETPGVPLEFALSSHPNPFNPSTEIRFALPEAERVTLEIFDVNGRLVRELAVEQAYAAGVHHLTWDGRDRTGRGTASGLYFARILAGEHRASQRLVLLK